MFLSFSDSDLAAVAAAWETGKDRLPSLRLASLAALRHPFSVDRYVEPSSGAQAAFVLVRLLGGLDYGAMASRSLRAPREDTASRLPLPGRREGRRPRGSTRPHPCPPQHELRRFSAICTMAGLTICASCVVARRRDRGRRLAPGASRVRCRPSASSRPAAARCRTVCERKRIAAARAHPPLPLDASSPPTPCRSRRSPTSSQPAASRVTCGLRDEPQGRGAASRPAHGSLAESSPTSSSTPPPSRRASTPAACSTRPIVR